MGNNYTSILADYAAGVRYEDLPEPVVTRAKQVVLDGIGCGLFGSVLPWSIITARVLRGFESTGKVGIWGTPYYLSAPHAALANGTFIHGFELDDYAHLFHVGAVILPAGFAIAQHKGGVSGRSLLAAIVAGTEVGTRVSDCMGLEAQQQGFHHPSIHGVIAAAATAGRVAELSGPQMVDCFSHAGSLAAGLMAVQYGGMMKRMLLGRAAQTGVYAALLAQEGFTGIEDIFEREYGGLCSSFSTAKKGFHLSKLVEGLAREYYTLDAEFKVYACRGPIHTALDAIRKLRSEGYPLAPGEIKWVRVRVPRWVHQVVGWKYVPQDITSAQLNLAYGVAVMLLEGDAFVDQYTEEKIRSAEILSLIDRIEVVHEPTLDDLDIKRVFASITEVLLRNGQRLEARIDKPRVCSDADLINKFRRLAGKAVDEEQVEKIANQVNSLESLDDVRVLAEMLTFRPK